MAKNALVIGLGSAGRRHASALTELNVSVNTVSTHNEEATFLALTEINQINQFQYVVVANETREHLPTLQALRESGFTGRVLVEKPLFHQVISDSRLIPDQIFVAYNLRYHPGFKLLQQELAEKQLCSIQCSAGQHLSGWNNARQYQSTYRARSNDGGVLRDLSHELDYLTLLTGNITTLTAVGGHFSDLEISSDDTFSLLFKTERVPVVSLNLDYLQRPPRRLLVAVTTTHTYALDFINSTLTRDNELIWAGSTTDLRKTTEAMHLDLLNPQPRCACTFDQALCTLKVIQAAFDASSAERWIKLDHSN